jgi:hypothetical protein
LLLAFLLNEKPPFIDELKNSLVLWVILALISGGLIFLWQFAMAPVRVKRELGEDRERILRESDKERQTLLQEAKEERERIIKESTDALQQAAKIRTAYGSNIVRTPSREAIKRQLGTELRDIRHKIEIVKSTQPTPQYSHGFRLPNARFDEYRERLAEDAELYPVIEKAYIRPRIT